jgi:hypothetical protein
MTGEVNRFDQPTPYFDPAITLAEPPLPSTDPYLSPLPSAALETIPSLPLETPALTSSSAPPSVAAKAELRTAASWFAYELGTLSLVSCEAFLDFAMPFDIPRSKHTTPPEGTTPIRSDALWNLYERNR